jgi:DNA polymerase-1
MADILLVDGHNIAFRSYYGIGELFRDDGFPTGAIYGYANSIWRLEDATRPERTVIFFDLGRSAKRCELLPAYKAQRSPMPEELRLQLPHIRRLAELMCGSVVERQGVEADDLLASRAVAEAAGGKSVAIASSDKDFAQIVGGRICQWRPPPPQSLSPNWIPMDAAAVEKKFSVSPSQMVDYLSLVGDAADNVEGVPRIGAKTAAKLLQAYGTVEGIRAHAAELAPVIAENLRTFADNLDRNRRLIAFDLSYASEESHVERKAFDLAALLDFFREFELQSLIGKASSRYGGKAKGMAQGNLFSF